jgi:hypothetical protein
VSGVDRVAGGAPVYRTEGPAAPDRPRRPGLDDTPPPAPGPEEGPVSDIPVLAMPQVTDGTDLLLQALILRIKNGDEQVNASVQEVQQNGAIQKSKNDEIAKQLADQLEKMNESKGLSGFLKAMQWIGVALAVIVAAVTLNPVAIAGAITAVTMAVLNETGVMEKMTDAIADSLMKNGMSESDAKKWSMGLSMAIGIGVSLIGLGAGAAASVTNTASKMAELVTKLADVVGKVATAAKVAQTTVTIAQAGVGIGKAVLDHEVANSQAETMELRAFLAKIKAAMDEETDRLTAMIQQSQSIIQKAMAAMGRVSETNSNIIRHMG